MKRILVLLSSLLLLLSFSACTGSINNPNNSYTQHLKNIELTINRADDSAIHITVTNRRSEPAIIDWNKSTINSGQVFLVDNGSGLNYLDLKLNEKIPNTVLNPGESYTCILYRKADVYYLDPVLYVPGGLRVKPLHYPARLDIIVDGIENIKDVDFLY